MRRSGSAERLLGKGGDIPRIFTARPLAATKYYHHEGHEGHEEIRYKGLKKIGLCRLVLKNVHEKQEVEGL
jgi:hypothetical protein